MNRWKQHIKERLDSLNLSPTREAEILEELSQHLEDRYRDLVSAGLKRTTAYAAVIAELDDSLSRELSNIERWIDREPPTLGAKGGSVMMDFVEDIRYGLRILVKNRGFAAVAILSLALGVGANTAIFQLFDAVFLRTLPVDAPEQLAEIKLQRPLPTGGRTGGFNGPHPELTFAQWEQIRERQQAFSGVFAWYATNFNLAAGGEARYARGLWVSGDFFNVLGVKPLIGRVFSAADDRRGCGSAGAVISYSFWQRALGGDRSVLGRPITLDGHTVDVIGVIPPEFTGLEVGRTFDIAMPICFEPVLDGEDNNVDRRHIWWLDVMGRLKPGWTTQQATAQLSAISPEILEATVPSNYTPEAAKTYFQFKFGAFPAGSGLSELRKSYDSPLHLLMALAGLVLLIGCANLANLLLARASSREREIAVRLAIGASRGRLVRQLLSESLLLALLGASVGAFIGGVLSRFLVTMMSTESGKIFVDLKPDWRVLLFSGGLALVTCLFFGVVPAIRASRSSPALTMRSASRGLTASREHFALRKGLVVFQVSLSLVLLVGSLLFSANLNRLMTLDAGFRQNGILASTLDFSSLNLPKDRRLAYRQNVLDRVRTIPGVDSAAVVEVVPMSGNGWNDSVVIDGDAEKRHVISNFNRVSKGFFETMAIPILKGRDFSDADTLNSPGVAIVNELFAKKLFRDADPLGAAIRVVVGPGEPQQIYQVIGLVRDSKYSDIHEDPPATVYVANSQDREPGPYARIMIHSSGSLAALTSNVKEAAAEVSPAISLEFQVMRTAVTESLLRERLLAALSGFFGLLAVLLACIGLYGVMSYGVTTRTGEIGVRLALGAERSRILWLVLREALFLVGIGILIGLPAVFGSIRLVSTLLFGPSPASPSLIALGALALIGVAALAAYLPARRASRTEPIDALRYE
ncbi:MAG TPA: ABC transporter permease [Blastocatellia bacterium]|nr:ABC transporter permease [Blastocatellia bacterium]